MWKENLYRPFEILLREHDDFPIGRHQHSFYEMVYILGGTGDFEASVFGSGQEHCRYRERDLFLIPPDTPHLFTIESYSRYVFIRFTQNYLSDFVGAGLAGLLELKSDFRIGLSGDDSGTLDRLMEMIVRETGSGRDFSEHLLQHYVHSVVLVCARNLSAIEPVRERAVEGRPRYMLQYIQQHLHQISCLQDRCGFPAFPIYTDAVLQKFGPADFLLPQPGAGPQKMPQLCPLILFLCPQTDSFFHSSSRNAYTARLNSPGSFAAIK